LKALIFRVLLAFGACALLFLPPAFGQEGAALGISPGDVSVISDHDARAALAKAANVGRKPGGSGVGVAPSTASLTTWTYSVTAGQDKNTYTGSIVGTSPFMGTSPFSSPTVTSVSTPVVPVVIKIKQFGRTYTFDPTAADSGCLGGNNAYSLFNESPLIVGFSDPNTTDTNTQYSDAFLKDEFSSASGSNSNSASYGVTLSTSTYPTVSKLTLSLNYGSNAAVYSATSGCGNKLLAVVNINSMDSALRSYMTNKALIASQFPFFLTYNGVMSTGSATNLNTCCVIGYHNALGSPGQTYAIADFNGLDLSRGLLFGAGFRDVAAASHEINEWMNDPGTTNPTPAWGGVGQVSGCQSDFEVGDPLTGTAFSYLASNSFTYTLQDAAYISWFYDQLAWSPNGYFSFIGTFRGDAKVCPPGGSN
jgi:hypothetical protein